MESKENYYKNTRTDLFLKLKSSEKDLGMTLDIGCGEGVTSLYMKKEGFSKHTVGVDLFADEERARKNLDEFFKMDIKQFIENEHRKFDTIIFADVLEHLIDPWEIFELVINKLLKNGGHFIVSLPNARSIKFLGKIIGGSFRYEEYGIFDKTHLRFFCKRDMLEMLNLSSTKNLRIYSKTMLEKRFLKRRVLVFLSLGLLKDFMTDQYIIYAEKI